MSDLDENKTHEASGEELEAKEDDGDILSVKSSDVSFRKSMINKGHVEVMKKLGYFRYTEIIRLDEEDTVPHPQKNEVVTFRCFFKANFVSLCTK